jgi:hypothetical protein
MGIHTKRGGSMLVKNIGSSPVLICDYNGKRYAFHRGIPVEITPEIYNSIIQSGHVTATEVVPVERPVIKNVDAAKPAEAPKEINPKRGRLKKR